MRLKAITMAMILAAGLAAGCGTETADSKQGTNTAADAENTAKGESTPGSSTSDNEAEERTEVRREKYDDCDGSGHGYVEIYYSDGSMETEEY